MEVRMYSRDGSAGGTTDLARRWGLKEPPTDLAKEYLEKGWWGSETLGQLVDRCLLSNPSRTVRIWSQGHPYTGTAGDLHKSARQLAAGLMSEGVGPGDIVAFQLPNWIEAAITFYGLAMLGAVIVPIVHFYGPKEVRFILDQSGAKALITADRFAKRDYLEGLEEFRADLANLERVIVVGDPPAGDVAFDHLLDSGSPLASPTALDSSLPALVAYTSGTTADPKGVVHAHRTLCFEIDQLSTLQNERTRANLTGAPVGHGIGMLSGLLVPLYRGLPLHLTDVWDPKTVLAAMLEADLAAGTGSTYFLTSLLDADEFRPEHLEKMRMVGLGGSPIPTAVAERAERLGISLVRSYGSTEHPSVTGSRHSAPASKRLFTDGKILDEIELRIVDDDGHDVAAGEAGEIFSRGPDRFIGYTDPKLTQEAIDDDGWYHTGDVGRFDPDGYLIVTDRKKDIIIRGGENISAAEVEGLLSQMDGVAEVVVVAAPDARLGEHGCAIFRMREGSPAPDLAEMRHHLEAAGLTRQKWPEEIRAVDEFPRTPSGKVKKVVLRDQLRAG